MESTMSLPKLPSLPPGETLSPSVTPPMLYVYEDTVWEYKLLVRTRGQDELPSEEEMNALGAQGWELAGIANQQKLVHFYFKRPGK
jgi:hypothetical protein